MKLPAADQAVIEVAKLREYLLSPTHSIGRFKAAFFSIFGYHEDNWRQLEADIRKLIDSHDAEEGQASKYGRKFEVRGVLTGPNGMSFNVVTVWIIRRGENFPRFVSAIPGEKS